MDPPGEIAGGQDGSRSVLDLLIDLAHADKYYTRGSRVRGKAVRKICVLIAAITLLMSAAGPRAQEPGSATALVQTSHPRLPRAVSQLWLVPDGRTSSAGGASELGSAVKLEVGGEYTKALAILSHPRLRQGPLGHYAELYKGVAELRLGRAEESRRTFQALRARNVVGYAAEAAALAEAESNEALGNHAAAVDIYERLLSAKMTTPADDVLMRLGRAARAAGEGEKATSAFARVYFDFALGDYAGSAGAELDRGSIVAGSERYQRQLARAQRLFAARRYEQARAEFENLRSAALDTDRELIGLRLAECDYYLKRARIARSALRPYVEQASSRKSEALYFYAVTARALGDSDDFATTLRRVADEFPTEPWAEEALNDLASHHVIQNEDDKADQEFRELFERFPSGKYAERAAWKIGWWAYRNDRFADTARVFEKAAGIFPRSDYRPAWLYWAGRARESLKEDALADARLRLTVVDYLNTYYGRLAASRLAARGVRVPERPLVVEASTYAQGEPVADAPRLASPPPNAAVVRALLSAGLFDQALDELKYAQNVWGDSSVIQATMAWTYLQQGRSETGGRQLTLWRGAINSMKRAYPQFMAAGGEDVPADLLRVIFPLAYWDLIRKYAAQYDLDPYLAAALIAQESTFVADIRSSANAVGLTQLLPSTARQYARTLRVRYASSVLTNPESNVQIGLFYLSEKIKEFGQLYLALASYNAGERPVHRWMSERPGLSPEEFIDDIPYPQTQNYVKKILGTADDYRRLYSSDGSDAAAIEALAKVPSAAAAPKSTPKKTAPKPTTKKKSRRAV